ncbi:uncharacterized protein LOC143881251 [Tasmannia lanceolata]|uniref:uncharacterized protein LOC143881251 n=1 Tax=Tasmannia lanceolata TaxID=3420 RepID=UPI004062D7B8
MLKNLIQADVEEFNDCVFDCALAEVRSVGHFYSWSNCSNTGTLKLRRLDRCLVNEEWLCNFPLTLANTNYKNSGLSDHSLLIVQIGQENAKRKTPFRFLNMWLDDLSLYEVVEKGWATNIKGNPMFRVVKKLKAVKESIKTWNRNIFGRVDNQLPIAKLDLDNIQTQLASDPANSLLKSKEFEAKQNVVSLSNLEESLLRQKARISWLNLGDSNFAFFHVALKTRRNHNSIQALSSPDGTISSDPDQISNSLVLFFQNLLNKHKNLIPPAQKFLNP